MEEWKLISAKRLSTCEICSNDFPIGTQIYWSKARSVIRCLEDLNATGPKKVDGTPGVAARTKFKNKNKKRQEVITQKYGKFLGSVINFLQEDSDEKSNWEKGFEGEEQIGEILNELSQLDEFFVLHDRKIPNSRANIDHIVISNRGVFIIDTKNYSGSISVYEKSNTQKSKEILYIGRVNQNRLIEGVKNQKLRVEKVLHESNFKIPVFGMLAFYEGNWSGESIPQEINGVLINSHGLISTIMGKPERPQINPQKIFALLKKEFKGNKGS